MGSKFMIYTDNNPLSYLQTVKLAAVEQRWASELASFEFEIKYRPGTVNRNADALSHLPKLQPCPVILPGITVPPQVADHFPQASNNQTEPTAHSMDAAPVRTQADLQALQIADPDIKAFLLYWRRGWPPSKAERAIESPRADPSMEEDPGKAWGALSGDSDTSKWRSPSTANFTKNPAD